MNLKERYNELCTQRAALRKEAIAAICNMVTRILTNTESKKLDYYYWASETCDLSCLANVFFKHGFFDSGRVVSIELDNTKSFCVEVDGEDTHKIHESNLSVDQLMELITDLEALEQSLSGEASDGKIEWKVAKNGVVHVFDFVENDKVIKVGDYELRYAYDCETGREYYDLYDKDDKHLAEIPKSEVDDNRFEEDVNEYDMDGLEELIWGFI